MLPPNKILAVLFADRGVVKSFFQKTGIYERLDDFSKTTNNTIPRQLLFTLIRIQNQLKIPARFAIKESAIISQPVPDLLPARTPKLRWYEEMCEHLQISKESGQTAYSEDSQASRDGYVAWRK